MVVALLQGWIQELAAKIRRCVSERIAAETAHCVMKWVLVKASDGVEDEAMESHTILLVGA